MEINFIFVKYSYLISTIVSIKLNTIEYFGGGSARCMMAEIFLDLIKKSKPFNSEYDF